MWIRCREAHRARQERQEDSGLAVRFGRRLPQLLPGRSDRLRDLFARAEDGCRFPWVSDGHYVEVREVQACLSPERPRPPPSSSCRWRNSSGANSVGVLYEPRGAALGLTYAVKDALATA